MEPSFYGGFSKTQSFRGLSHIEVLHVSQNEYRAIDVRQLRNGFGNRLAHFLLLNDIARQIAPIGKLLWVKRLIFGCFRRVLINLLIQMLAPLAPTHLGLIFNDAHCPLLELVFLREFGEMRKDLDHCLLHCFLSIVLIAENRIGAEKSPALVWADQVVEQVLLPRQDSLNQQWFAPWPG